MPAGPGAREQPFSVGVGGVPVFAALMLVPKHLSYGFGYCGGYCAEFEEHALRGVLDVVMAEHDDPVYGVGPEQQDEACKARRRDDVVVIEAVANQFDPFVLGDHRHGMCGSERRIELPVRSAALPVEPAYEVADMFAGAGPAAEIFVDVGLPESFSSDAIGVAEPDEKFGGFGNFLFGRVGGGFEIYGWVRGSVSDALEVMPCCETFDVLGCSVFGQVADFGGEPLLEPYERFVAAPGHDAVVHEQVAQVFGGGGPGERVEGFVGEWKCSVADGVQEFPGLGARTHIGLDAFGPAGFR